MGGVGHGAAVGRSGRPICGECADYGCEPRDELARLVRVDDERGQQADHALGGHVDEQAFRER